ncbi:type-2 ice-structuring protein-like [Sander vitreus]
MALDSPGSVTRVGLINWLFGQFVNTRTKVDFINFSMKMLAVSVLLAAMMALTTVLPEAEADVVTGQTIQPNAERENGKETLPKGEDHVVKSSIRCDIGWSLYRGCCFRYFPAATSWAVAEKSCLSFRGNLASVHNTDEEFWIQRLAGNNPAWIGGSDAQQEGFWFWSDGTPLKYVNWCGGEPNNKGSQHCLQINWIAKKCWDDNNCNAEKGYVCAQKLDQHRGMKY